MAPTLNETIDEMLQIIEANKIIVGLSVSTVELTAFTLQLYGILDNIDIDKFIEEMVEKRGLDKDTINQYKKKCAKLYEYDTLMGNEWGKLFSELDKGINYSNPILALTQKIILVDADYHRQDMMDDGKEDDEPPMKRILRDYKFNNDKVIIVIHSDDNKSFDCTITMSDNQQTRSFDSFKELLDGIRELYSHDALEKEDLTEIASMLCFHFDSDGMKLEDAVEYVYPKDNPK